MTPAIARTAVSPHPPADSLAGFVPPPPLPDPVAGVFRFLFNVPQWIQIAGFFLGLVVLAWLGMFVLRRRKSIAAWFGSRAAWVRRGFAIAAVLTLGAAAWGGASTWNYMQHDNDFCMSCHVMETPFQRFSESEHRELSCHDCHQQSIFASARQMVLWVAQRPEDISDHAPVPNARCENCHVTGEPESWRRIRETAGHKIHLESSDTALAGVECVTCHGVEVHRFTPVDATCGTTGCHDDVRIRLGKMAEQSSLHCVACHRFTAEVGAEAGSADAQHAIGPRLAQCNACHEMRAMIPDFDPARDPHGGECGTCHNPHTQERSEEAGLRCAACHDDWSRQPFHQGPAHASVGQSCTLCHAPHRAAVDASDCVGCHREVSSRPGIDPAMRRKLAATLPLETSAAPPASAEEKGAMKGGESGGAAALGEIVVAGRTFSHAVHAGLPCLRCHDPASTRSVASFTPPQGCDECHHGEVAAASGCAECHSAGELAGRRPAEIRVAVANHAPRTGSAAFDHADHDALLCESCHTPTRSQELRADAASCTACHENHHAADRTCGECHSGVNIQSAHHGIDPHVACDACHEGATIAALLPDRGFCLTCHADMAAHQAASPQSCSSCHFLADPHQFRARLLSSSP
jgi:nitrate/TMAO reductase-like tetraheme cytochrome c subunit